MNKIFRSSYPHFLLLLRTPRSRSLPPAMQAVYSTSSLRQANAMPFKSLTGTLDPGILKALDEMQYEYMTPVQEKVLSLLPTLHTDWYFLILPCSAQPLTAQSCAGQNRNWKDNSIPTSCLTIPDHLRSSPERTGRYSNPFSDTRTGNADC